MPQLQSPTLSVSVPRISLSYPDTVTLSTADHSPEIFSLPSQKRAPVRYAEPF